MAAQLEVALRLADEADDSLLAALIAEAVDVAERRLGELPHTQGV